MPKSSSVYPLLAIIGWSLLVHLPGITSPLLDYHAHRQCQTASMSRNFLRNDMNFIYPQLDNYGGPIPPRAGTEFPIYSYIIALLYKVFGVHETIGRLFSVALTAWSAVFLFLFVRRRLGERIAMWSSLAMCSIPIHIYFTRTFQPEPMAMWGLLGFLYYFDRWIQEGRRRDVLLAIGLGAVGPLLKLPYLYLIGGLWLALVWESRLYKRISTTMIALGSLVLMVSSTTLWYAWAKTAPAQVLPMGLDYHFSNLLPLKTLKFWTHLTFSRFPELLTTYSGLLLGLFGWKAVRDRFFKAWFAITIVYTILCGEYGIIHKYTSLPWAAINGVFIGAGIVALSHAVRAKWWGRALLVVLILGIPIHSAFRIKHWYRLERLYLFNAKQIVQTFSSPGDLFFTITDEHPVLLYYIDRYGWAGRIDSMTPQQMTAALSQNIRYVITPVDEVWKERPEWAAYFGRHGRLAHADTDYLIYEIL